MCSGSVIFIFRRDPRGYFRFATLQEEAGRRFLAEYMEDNFDQSSAGSGGMDSIILIEDGIMHTHSTAVLRIVRKLRHFWPLLYAFIIVPRFIRDPIYNWVARNRYRWFGKRDHCFVPSGDLTNRFIT